LLFQSPVRLVLVHGVTGNSPCEGTDSSPDERSRGVAPDRLAGQRPTDCAYCGTFLGIIPFACCAGVCKKGGKYQ
jgi:hypothetical protein